jgi:L-iditol 2-dehydrogenase
VNTCLKAVEKAAIIPGETVIVAGQGPIGLLLMQLARWLGATVVATDPLVERRARSVELGASFVLDSAGDVPAEVRDLTEGRGADCAILAAGGEAAFTQAVAATRPAGRILSFAATSPGETAEVDLGVLTTSEKDILTAYSSSIDLQEQAAELVFTRQVRVREIVSHRLPIDRAAEAFALAMQPGPQTLKIVLQMAREGAGR